MLDSVVAQLEQVQENGIWAWDCLLNEPVLIFPVVLALLGDNPMQSRRGGKDAAAPAGSDAGGSNDTSSATSGDGDDEAHSVASQSSVASGNLGMQDKTPSKKKTHQRKVLETFEQMQDHITAFIKPGKPCNRQETTATLHTYFTEAQSLNTQTKIKKMHTKTGIKDTYWLYFIEQLFQSYKNKCGTASRAVALQAKVATLPSEPISPVWQIKGLDPHSDTPVEILHVILLGFIKYMW
ncbi:hypothetical protein CPB84DRAFT_1858409 [Gymnopilus junonius]|uniref:Uncharacterized protein n=1 Tax=Gymnopilus junonius TaxID=109634 RepID=A0A9P5N6G0_GYMJU|nr:hypothetical protein CPB84DRAFT_1858409 [Gymnopilus junonius]